MANQCGTRWFVKIYNCQQTLLEILLNILYILLIITINFLIQTHSPNLPKHQISFLQQMPHHWKLHERRPSKTMTKEKDLRICQLFDLSMNKNSMKSLFFIDWDIKNLILKIERIEKFPFEIINHLPLFYLSFCHFLSQDQLLSAH